MSLPGVTEDDAARFFAPLEGKVTILLFGDNMTKTRVSNFMLRCASARNERTIIFDADAFYCTRIRSVTKALSADFMSRTELLLLATQEARFEPRSLSPLISSNNGFVIIDGMNSLYSTASQALVSRELMAFMRMLSLHAKLNQSLAISTAHRTGWTTSSPDVSLRSLDSLGDLLIDARTQDDGSISLRGRQRGMTWLNDEFVVGNYFDV